LIKKEYIILLPNEKASTYNIVTLLILLINCFVFSSVMIREEFNFDSISTMGTMISFLSLIFFLVKYFTKKLAAFRPEISFLILGLCWLLLGKILLAASILCFAVIGFYTFKKFKVIFSPEKILYPSFPNKTYLWSEVNNVMLKDKVLTIDLKNNKLIQAVIDKASADEIDEKEFNEFCIFSQRRKEAKTQ
jgi:hypothetical protein